MASQDVELVGVVEIDKGKIKSFSEKNKDIAVFNSFEDLLKSQKLDFIIVALPHFLHYEITKKAISENIHVLKEKPFTVSLEQAQELKQIADSKNVQIEVTLQRRFNPIYSTFFQLIDKIGKPFYIESKYTFFTEKPHEGWRGKKKLAGGGCLIDMGYHIVDLLMWYFGLPDRVFAETSCAAKEGICYDAEDTAQILFRYEKEEIWGSLLISRVIPPKQEYLNVYGTRGFIHLERGKIKRYSSDGELQESLNRESSWPSAAQDQIEYFVKVIRGEKKNISNPHVHINHLALIEAAYKSSAIHQYINPREFLKS
jgi:predicted dehydrogenase